MRVCVGNLPPGVTLTRDDVLYTLEDVLDLYYMFIQQYSARLSGCVCVYASNVCTPLCVCAVIATHLIYTYPVCSLGGTKPQHRHVKI